MNNTTNLMMHLYVSNAEVLVTLFCEDYGGLGLIYIYICVYAEKFYAKILNCLLEDVGGGREGLSAGLASGFTMAITATESVADQQERWKGSGVCFWESKPGVREASGISDRWCWFALK